MIPQDKTFTRITLFCLLLTAPVAAFTEESPIHANGGSVAPEAPNEALYLDVPGVIERIKAENLQLLVSRESVRRALEQSYQRRAALLPQFAVRAEQARQQIARGVNGAAINASPFDRFSGRIEASLSLFDTQRYADYRIARLGLAIAEDDLQLAVQDFLEQAIFVYFSQLRDLRNLEIVQGNLEREKELFNLAKLRFDAGAAVKIDVTRAQVRVAAQRRALMQAETDLQGSALQLKSLLNIDLDRPIVLDRSFVEDIPPPPSPQPELINQRPDILSQEKQLRRADLARKAAGWQRLPSLDLFADWGYDSRRALDGEEGEAWLVGLRANMPLWEGGRIAAEKREASAAVRQNEYQLSDLRNRVEEEYTFALIEMDSRFAQIEIASDEVRLGRDEVAQARERYEEGLADNRELIDAQNRLSDAELSRLNAVYQYGLSRLAFARAVASVETVLD